MRRTRGVCGWLGVWLLAAQPAWAGLMGRPTAGPEQLCDAAIAVADQAGDLPAHLLRAIGRVESGRRDPVTGGLAPWPWTIDVEGEGHLYDNEPQAIAAVRSFQAAGLRSIDVGCMQVNLIHHAGAFSSLEEAFDPGSNVAAAAAFLRQLHDTTGNWMAAAGQYHSGTPTLAEPYREKVAAMMQEDGGTPGADSLLAMGMPRTPPPMTMAMAVPPAGAPDSALRGMVLPMQPRPKQPAMHGPGRSLAAYRAMPVALADRPPPPG